MGGTEKSGGETKILKRGEGANWVKGGGGAGTPLGTMPSIFTLYFKFLSATFLSQILMYSLKPPPPHPLICHYLLSMTKLLCCCTLLNDATKL